MAIRKISLFCLIIIFIFNVASAKRLPEKNQHRFSRQTLDIEFEKSIEGLKRKRRELLEKMVLNERTKQNFIPETLDSINKAYQKHKRETQNVESELQKRIKRDIEQFYELENTPNVINRVKRRDHDILKELVSNKNKREIKGQINNQNKRSIIFQPDNLLIDERKRRDKRNVDATPKKKVKQHEKSSNYELDKHKKNLSKKDIHDHVYKGLKHKKHDDIYKKEKRHVKRYLNWRERMRQKREQKRELKNARIHASVHNHIHREKRFEKHEKAAKNLNRFKRYKSQKHSVKRQKNHV